MTQIVISRFILNTLYNRENYKAIATHLDTLQVSMATVQMLRHPRNSCYDNLGKEEKLIQQNLGLPESPSPLLHLQRLLLQTGDQ